MCDLFMALESEREKPYSVLGFQSKWKLYFYLRGKVTDWRNVFCFSWKRLDSLPTFFMLNIASIYLRNYMVI